MKKNSSCKQFLSKIACCFQGLLILTVIWASGPAHVFAQSAGKTVTIHAKNQTVKNLLQEIQKQTGINFAYNEKILSSYTSGSLEVIGQSVGKALQLLFEGTDLTYSIDGNTVTIYRKMQHQAVGHKKVKGKITDEQGAPLPGVAVLIAGTTIGTASDIDGNYSLDIPGNVESKLQFSMIGMELQEIAIGSRTVVDVILRQAHTEIDEVVVTGIFKKARESYTGSVSTITDKDLQVHRGQNLLQTLKNADASLNFAVNNVAGSNPNNLPQLNIRGNSSLPMSVQEFNESASNAVNTPLIIMDGFEISLEKLMDYNDDEISSINILKDAAATAIYGSRGSNGVIVIVTKQPEPGRLRVNAEVGIDMEVPDLTSYDLLNAGEKLELERQVGLYQDNNPNRDFEYKKVYNERLQRVLSGATTDWINKPIRTGVGTHYNLRLEGGSEQFRWSATMNYKNVQGAMKNSSRRTFNGAVMLMYKIKNFTFKNYSSYGMVRGKESNYGKFSDYVAQQPYNLPYDEHGNVVKQFEDFRGYEGSGGGNPLWDASLNTLNKQGYEELTDNFAVEWNITKDFLLRGQFGITHRNNHNDYLLPAEHSEFTTGSKKEFYATDEGMLRRGIYKYGNGKMDAYDANVTLAYNKTWNERHQLYAGLDYSVSVDRASNVLFVLEGYKNKESNFVANGLGYETDGIPSGSQTTSRRIGFTGNINYTFDSRYYVDLSYRVDGSSTFGSDKKWAPFWSAGLGWNIHRERFMENNDLFSNLRLKASYGQTGSQIGSGSGASTVYADVLNNKYLHWTGSQLREWGNSRLTWQTTDEFNVGAEIGLWQNRIKAEFDFYTKKTDNLLSNMDLPLSMGLPSYVANVGAVKNRGWEASLNAYIIRDSERELSWMVGGQLVYDKNWISKLSDAIKAQTEEYLNQDVEVSNLFYEGNPQNSIYAVRSAGIDPSTGEEIFLDRNGKITDTWHAGDKVYLGSKDPLYRGNLSTMVMWKGFTFNMSFAYRWGGKVYNQTLLDRVEVTIDKLKSSNVDRRVYEERWTQPGDKVFYKGFGYNTTRATSRFVMKDNVFELQSASLQYRWDSEFVRRQLHLASVTFAVNVSDLFHWSYTRLERGTDYPFARNIQGSVKILF